MNASIYGTICGLAVFALAGHVARAEAPAGSRAVQSRPAAQEHTQFTDKDRETTKDWASQHQAHPAVGFRSQDKLSADQESRLQPGRRLDPDLQKRVHTVPADLSHRLPPPPRNHRYVAIGGHVGLLDSATQVLNDIIHIH